MNNFTKMNITNFNKYFDHTLLKPDASDSDILNLLSEAATHDFASVCVNSCHVKAARRFIDGAKTGLKLAAVAGFPLGAMSTNAKAYEVQLAIEDGADEIDLVMNIGKAKSGNWAYIEDEIFAIAKMCHESEASAAAGTCCEDARSCGAVLLKVIVETCLLTDEEIARACEAAISCGADFVKTSTGFAGGGATVEHVKLMREIADSAAEDHVGVKASGGIRSLDDALAMIEAGADRLGCSASVAIMEEYLKRCDESQ